MSTRRRSTRRTVLRTIRSLGLAAVTTAGTVSADDGAGEATSTADAARSRAASSLCETSDVTRYVATVDRIVDGRHVVLLLEDDGELVDQHVAPRSRLEGVDEGDVLLVLIGDGDLLVALPLPKRPGRSSDEQSPQERFDSLADGDA